MPKVFLDSCDKVDEKLNYFLDSIFDETHLNLLSSAISSQQKNSDTDGENCYHENSKYNLNLMLRTGQHNSEGIKIYHEQGIPESLRASKILEKNLMLIFPWRELIKLEAKNNSSNTKKLTQTPAVSIELFGIFSKKSKDWTKNNVESIGKNFALSISEFFGLPFVPKSCRSYGNSCEKFNLTERPTLNSKIIAIVPNGAEVKILGQWEDWYTVEFDGNLGYANTKFISNL